MGNIVEIKYEQTGNSSNTDALGMREMQAKVYKARDEQLFSEKKCPFDEFLNYTIKN